LNRSFPFQAISLDVDGTMYDKAKLRKRIILKMPFSIPFIRQVISARETLRTRGAEVPDFKRAQAAILARRLGKQRSKVESRLEKVVYKKLPGLLSGIPAFENLHDVLKNLAAGGTRLAVLSDFPAREKISALGLEDLPWDVVLAAESFGVLKPHPRPFKELAKKLALDPEQILHVGDREDCDIKGAEAAGFKAILFSRNNQSSFQPSFARWDDFISVISRYYN